MYKSNNIILIGFKGAGKTGVSKLLAKAIDYSWIDFQDFIEKIYATDTGKNKRYRDIIKDHDESYFQVLQRRAFERIRDMNHAVIAAAGNTPFDPNARRSLRRLGQIIFMRPGPDEILEKMTEKGTPHFLDKNDVNGSFERYYAKGIDIYQTLCDHIIWVTGMTTEQIVKKIQDEVLPVID
jgi:shikimate kinase